MRVTSWWTAVLLVGAIFRSYRLLAKDTILDRPRAWILNLPRDWEEGQPLPKNYRSKIGDLLLCPWCLGFWLTLVWWAVWQLWPHGTEVIAAVFLISAAVGLLAGLDRDD